MFRSTKDKLRNYDSRKVQKWRALVLREANTSSNFKIDYYSLAGRTVRLRIVPKKQLGCFSLIMDATVALVATVETLSASECAIDISRGLCDNLLSLCSEDYLSCFTKA